MAPATFFASLGLIDADMTRTSAVFRLTVGAGTFSK